MEKLYIAYGSNMNIQQMAMRCVNVNRKMYNFDKTLMYNFD